ncbi:DUF947-domain-containing protein [Hypomontagnella monticulosa]|nr:DUF947-domain-containing protein [Hypomontagnella monticulosa]
MDRVKANKRKAPLSNLQRRVRARRDEPEEIFSDESHEEGSEDEGSEEEDEEEEQDDEEEEQDDDESGSSEEEEDDEVDNPSAAVSQISFGALAKAQAALPNVRRGKGRRAQEEEEDDDDDEDEDDGKHQRKSTTLDSKPKLPKPQRSSKHAPAEQSSKRQVSRRREVVATHKPIARDPRFSSAVSARPFNEDKTRQAYSFLETYRDSEMAQLKEAIKKTKDAAAKEELKRALTSMQGRKQAQQQRGAERAVLEEHRRREKELVQQGKKPFYLKKSEQKKQMLVNRFADMKGKQVDKVIERRRKKLAARERRDAPMPGPRREAR